MDTSFLSSLLTLTSPLYFFLFFPIVLNSVPPFCCHSIMKLSPRSPRKQTLQSSQSRRQRPETQRLLPHLPLRSLKWRSPVWGRSLLGLMRMAMMRRYRVQGSCVSFLKRRVSRTNVFSLNQARAMEACLLLTLLSFMKSHG